MRSFNEWLDWYENLNPYEPPYLDPPDKEGDEEEDFEED